MLAGLSTAFSFLPFILTGFRGLMELGMITGMGILLTVFADFTVLPALSQYLAVAKPSSKLSNARESERYLLRLGPTGVRTVLAAALVLSVVGAILASRVQFDLNPLRLQSKNAESVYWEKVLVENSTHSIISAAVVTDSPENVKSESAKFKALPTVSDVDNVFTLLPEPPGAKNTDFEVHCSHGSGPEAIGLDVWPRIRTTTVSAHEGGRRLQGRIDRRSSENQVQDAGRPGREMGSFQACGRANVASQGIHRRDRWIA